MNKNEIVLLELIKKSLFGVEVTFPEDTDWDEVQKEAIAQTVTALSLPAVPKPYAEKWKNYAAQSLSHYMRTIYEQTNLVKLLNDNNIPFVILKGTAAAVYYNNPSLRTMGDIDFIVEPKNYDYVIELLGGNGYVQEEDPNCVRHTTFYKGNVDFELHKQYSHDAFNIDSLILSGMKNRVIREINGHSFPTLPDSENGLVLLEHIHHHISYGGVGIRQLIDWAMFSNRVLDDKYYKESFLPLIKSVGLERFCENITKTCKMYLGLPDTFTWCDGADNKAATDIIELVMQNGNFGVKHYGETESSAKGFVFAVKKDGLMRTLQGFGCENFAICRKYRFFHAFAWLFQIFRYIWKGLVALLGGKILIKDINEGKEKADFYKRLGL